jgi:hypothetical protein
MKNQTYVRGLSVMLGLMILLAGLTLACSTDLLSSATPTPVPTDTPLPTATPTETPAPTDTATPEPTDTPTPEPTDTPAPEPTSEPKDAPTPAAATADKAATLKRALLWKLSTNVSLAAVAHGQGLPEKSVNSVFNGSQTIAKALGIKLPDLFEKSGDKAKDMAAATNYLLKEVSPLLTTYAEANYGKAEVGMVTLGVKSTLGLILYSQPKEGKDNTTVLKLNDSLYKGIQSAGVQSKLPDYLYKSVLEGIQKGLAYDVVKDRIVQMQKQVGDYLTTGQE